MAESHDERIIQAAVEAIQHGFTPIAVQESSKRPMEAGWQHTRWREGPEGAEEVRRYFRAAFDKGSTNISLLPGKPSGGLVDIDLDHPLAIRLRDYFLPPSTMETGREGRPRSHRWYHVDDVPGSRPYKMPDGSMCVELRASGHTVIPPSIHPSGESYVWEGEAWGGEDGPSVVDGKKLAVQVALLGLAATLLEKWPKKGGRHEAYLHLAGGLLRYGSGVHPFWEKNLPVLIEVLADVTHDEDGAQKRVSEVMATTMTRIKEGGQATGFPSLADIIGADHAEGARRRAKDVESLAGFVPEVVRSLEAEVEHSGIDEAVVSTLPPEERNPLEERLSSWEAVDLEPYLSGQVTMPEPSVLRRTDGKGLFYPGRVNSLYGASESAKSWISLYACAQEISMGERAMYLDLEDDPAGTTDRLKRMGVAREDIEKQFRYVRPEEPLASMQRNRFGSNATDDGIRNESVFKALLEAFDPTLIVADGMTVLYGLHGLDTNDAMSTDVITSWLKKLTRGGRSTVVVIDHTGKGGGAGSSPIGAHHKVAMVQGSAIRADAIERPMPGILGTVNLMVFKDRPGAVRQISSKGGQEQLAAEVSMDSREEGITRMTVSPPEEGTVVIGSTPDQEAKLMALAIAEDRKNDVLAMFDGDLDRKLKTPEVMRELNLEQNEVYDVWTMLIQDRVIVREGSNRHTAYRLYDSERDGGEK